MPTPQQVAERRRKFLEALPDRIRALTGSDAPVPFMDDPIKQIALYIQLKTSIDQEMSQDERQEKFNYWTEYVNSGKATIYKEFNRLPEEYRLDMAIDRGEDDRTYQQDYALLKAKAPSPKTDVQDPNDVVNYERKTALWEKTLFNPETDRTAFEKLTIPALKEAHEKMDDIKIPLPEGMTEEEGRETVIAAVFSEFAKPESILKIGHRVNEVQGNISSTVAKQHPEETSDKYYIWDGRTFLYDNTLTTQDGRDNSYVPRLMGPEFREKAKEILATYPQDPSILAKHLKEGFDGALTEANAGSLRRNRYHSYFPAEMAIRLYNVLNRPQFKDYVTFNDRDKQMISYLEADTKMTMRYGTLSNELNQYAFERSLRGSTTSPAEDQKFQDMLLEYKALNLYFTRKARDVGDIQSRMLEVEGTFLENRNLTQIEKDLADNPEGYVKRMKTLILASEENQKLEGTQDTWKKALDSLPKHLGVGKKIGEKESSLLMPAYERTVMPTVIRKTVDALKEYLTLPTEPIVVGGLYVNDADRTKEKVQRAKETIRMLEELPCMKGRFISNDSSEEELNHIADLYENARNFMNENKLQWCKFVSVSDDGIIDDAHIIKEIKNITDDLCGDLQKEAESLRGLTRAFANEREFIEEKFDAIEKAAKERTESLARGIRRHDGNDMEICGRPTEANCDAMLADAIEENGQRLEKYTGYREAMEKLKNLNPVQQKTGRMKSYEMLEKVQNEMSEKMLDDDSESLMQDYTAITRVMSALSLRIDVKEPVPGSGTYQRVYDRLGQQMRHIDTDMEKLEPESKMYELAVRARDAMDKVQRAVAGECYDDRGPDADRMANLKNTDDLSVIYAYQVISASPNPKLQTLLEQKGVDKLLKTIDSSDQLKAAKRNLTIQGLSNMLGSGSGFASLAQEPQGNKGLVNGVKAPVNSNERVSNASAIGGSGR